MKIMANGQYHEFPDDANINEINEALGINTSSEVPKDITNRPGYNEFVQATGMENSPGATLANAASNILYGMGKGSENIARMVVPNAPAMPDIRTSNNPIAETIGQYALPAVASGGASIPAQMGILGGYGMTQSKPGLKNRIVQGIEDALFGGAGGTALKYGKDIFNYLRPEKEAKAFVESLHGGTSQENIDTLAKRLQFARQSAERESLIPKEELMSTEAKKSIVPTLPPKQPDVQGIANIFDVSSNQELEKLNKVIKSYYQHGDVDKFIDEAENSFPWKQLNEKEEAKIESMLPFEKRQIAAGSYRSTKDVTDPYSANGKLMELHDAYMKNPNFENSDDLISAIKKQERKYEGTKEDVGIRKLEELKRNRKALESDQEKFFETLPPEKQNLYREFREKYKINKEKYENKKTSTLTALASEEPGGITPANVRSQFSGNLRQNVLQALEDIGPSGKENILYNELADLKPGDVGSLSDRIAELKQTGGMQRYITPEQEALIENLSKRLRHRKALGYGAAGIGALGGAYMGYPKTSALGGAGAAAYVGRKQLINAILKSLGKV